MSKVKFNKKWLLTVREKKCLWIVVKSNDKSNFWRLGAHTKTHGRVLGLCFGVSGVSERLVSAPAATLRRLQDGGSPDNSGAAGKSLFTVFFLMFQTYLMRTCVTFSFLSNRWFFSYILSRWLFLEAMWCSKQHWPVRTLPSLLTPVWLTAVSMSISMMAFASSRDHLTGCLSRILAPIITRLYVDHMLISLMLTGDTSLPIVCPSTCGF